MLPAETLTIKRRMFIILSLAKSGENTEGILKTYELIIYENVHYISWGQLMVAQWLRYCPTNLKVAGSIPDGVIGIFH
jgi:hypothetical protein